MLVAVMTMTIFSFVIAYPRMREEEGGKSVASMVILLILSALVLVSAVCCYIGRSACICPALSIIYLRRLCTKYTATLDADASKDLSAMAASCIST